MNKNTLLSTVIAIMVLVSVGCVSTRQEKEPVKVIPFPDPVTNNMSFCKPVNIYSKDKADAILQNLQPYIYQLRSETILAHADDVVVDSEAIKIKWIWEEKETEVLTQNSTTTENKDATGDVLKAILSGKKEDMIGALISGATSSPSQSTTTNMQVTKKVEKHNKTIVMFEDVSNVLRYMSNYVIIKLKSGEDIYIICNNEYYMQKWIDAFFSAMNARGYKPDFMLGVICQTTPMTQKQIEFTGIHGGAVVLGVMPGSPAEEMGLEYRDIITKLNGVTISSVGDIASYIKNKKPRKNDKLIFEIAKIRIEGDTVNKSIVTKEYIVKN
ncbi:MAG: PDZ domain-containing protein [Spirochaetota bacterium]